MHTASRSIRSVASSFKLETRWRNTPLHEWNDLRWQLANLVRTPEQLGELLSLPEEELAVIRAQSQRFRWAISPYYFSLIDPRDPDDPIRRMIVPSSLEDTSEGLDDPLGEKQDQVAPGLTHRYPDRVLFVVTSFCSSYCRFCIRKRNWRNSDAARSKSEIDEAIAYLRAHDEVRDVLISGGDPLTLPLEQLEYILSQVRSVPHVEFVRIGSREPVMLPLRIGDELLRVLDRHGPLWINTHFNHPREITEESAIAIERLARLGIPLGNQTVLLKGVNDDLATLRALMHGLLRIRVRPYYLYQADPVVGATHLRTSVEQGIALIEGLRGHTTGLAVPTFVVDAPGGGGKIPVGPEYVVERRDNAIVLRNYAGETFVYDDRAVRAVPAKKRALAVLNVPDEREEAER